MMRSFALIGFSYLIAMTASVYFGATVAIAFAIVFLCLFIISLFIKECRNKKLIPIVLVTMSAAFFYYGISYTIKVVPIEKLNNTTADISGVICDVPYKSYNKYYYMIETYSINLDGAPQKIKLRVSSNTSLDAEIYDRVTAQVKLFLPNGDKGFSSKTYYAAKNIHMFAYFSDYGSIKIDETTNKPANYYILKLKQELISRIKLLLGDEESAVAEGILLGYKFDISEDVKTDFKHSGISHLLAVSGYHVAVIASFMFILFDFFKLPKKFANLGSIAGVVFFMALTGFSPSVTRAGIMYILYLVGQLISRSADSLNSLGIAAFIICILNPFAGGDIGLLLSITATLGIIKLSPILSSWLKSKTSNIVFGKRTLNSITEAISVTLSANIFTLPITMLTFKCLYPISLVSNILIIFAFSAMMFCLIIAIILSYLGFLSILAIPFSLITTLLIKYMVWCAGFLANLPFSYLSADFRFLLIWLSGSMILLAITIVLGKDLRLIKITAILSAIILMVGTISYQILVRGVTTVAFLNVGNGVSSVITKDGNSAVISCGGDSFYADCIYEYLESKNIKNIDLVLASDDNDKTSSFVEEIVNIYKPYSIIIHDKVLDDSKELFESISGSKKNCITFSDSVNSSFWENVNISVLNNDGESYIYLTVNDVRFLICPSGGDVYSLPGDWKYSAFAVYSDIPDNEDMIKSRYAVLSVDEKDLLDKTEKLVKNGKRVITTLENDPVLIDCIDKNEVSIHR